MYSRIKENHDQLMARYGQGAVTLTQSVTMPGANEWDPPTTIETEEALDAIVSGVAQEFVDGSTIVATDVTVQCSVPSVLPEVGDYLKIDGKPHTVLIVHPLPGAGDPVAMRMICRG